MPDGLFEPVAFSLESGALAVTNRPGRGVPLPDPGPASLSSNSSLSYQSLQGEAETRFVTAARITTPAQVQDVDRVRAQAAHLRFFSTLRYSLKLADRIDAIASDWPPSDETPGPNPASLRALLLFLRGHSTWPYPRLYANDVGQFEVEWSLPSAHHLGLLFRDFHIVEYIYRSGAGGTGETDQRWGVIPIELLNRQLAALRIERWIWRANAPR